MNHVNEISKAKTLIEQAQAILKQIDTSDDCELDQSSLMAIDEQIEDVLYGLDAFLSYQVYDK